LSDALPVLSTVRHSLTMLMLSAIVSSVLSAKYKLSDSRRNTSILKELKTQPVLEKNQQL
jgi:hypothetical protein